MGPISIIQLRGMTDDPRRFNDGREAPREGHDFRKLLKFCPSFKRARLEECA
jgi:hypothetical protein